MKRLGVAILFICSLGLLSACSEGEELLQKVNMLIDQQLEKSDENEQENTTIENDVVEKESTKQTQQEETPNNEATANETEEEVDLPVGDGDELDDDTLTFEEKFASKGYTKLDPPNGMPVPVHESWILIEERMDDPVYEGVFVFNAPMEDVYTYIEEILEAEHYSYASQPFDSGDYVYQTEFSLAEDGYQIEGDMSYFIDDIGLTYVKVYFKLG